jgi:DNA-binding beta-propeller fold protein YncE
LKQNQKSQDMGARIWQTNGWRLVSALIFCTALIQMVSAQLVLSGNENKIDLTSGAPRVMPVATGSDSISILDFATFPPKVRHLENIANTVIGPPSNIAITPDKSLALIANSLKLDPDAPAKWSPITEIHILDLEANPPRVTGHVQAGQQPSGMSISRDGKFALVANRAEGSVTLLQIDGKKVRVTETIKVSTPEESISDVAISPDGKFALASVQKGGYLAWLRVADGHVQFTGRKISAYGQPYRCVITPDGDLCLTAGLGFGNGVDRDAVSVIELRANPIGTTDYIPVGAGPESIEISPNGKLLAVVVMNGSNLAADNSFHSEKGALEILVRRGKTFKKVESHPVGAIPEGVAFTSDGRYLVVQCHPARELWMFRVEGESVKDTGERIKVPGMPSSLRAAP